MIGLGRAGGLCAKGALRSDDEQNVDRAAHLHVIVLRCIQLLGKGEISFLWGTQQGQTDFSPCSPLQPKVRLAQMDQVTSSTQPT